MNIESKKFGNLPDKREVQLFTLSNDNGIFVKITNYGGIITQIMLPCKNGKKENIVCGFVNLEDYLSDEYLGSYPYFGAIIGRFGNRIAKGILTIEGVSYQLAVNNPPNHLHGGNTGFDKKLWTPTPFQNDNSVGIELNYQSPHMEENYPGNLDVTCIYSLNNQNELGIEYFARTDQTTVVSLTNHTYFNLNGGKENILDHEMKIAASKITEAKDLIPTGKIIPVEDTPYDFREFKIIGRDIEPLPIGYDDNFLLDNADGNLQYAGTLREKSSGRQVDVFTTQPGMQFYSGYWNPLLTIDGIQKFGRFSGVALETQHFPDSVHHPEFPDTTLHPGETYNEKTVYKFYTG